MDAWIWIVIAVIVVIAIALAAAAWSRKRRSEQLRERFGPEYDRTVERADDRRDAERDLRQREERREQFDIQPLSPAARQRYADEWQNVQAKFVDDPESAVREADRLVQQAMGERGYPVDDDFEQRADDLSVDHPEVVESFREGHGLWQRYDRGEGSTEDLRQSMVSFRRLFEVVLVEEPVGEEVRG
jgi:FtsZ-interacting cell division protein ZipA